MLKSYQCSRTQFFFQHFTPQFFFVEMKISDPENPRNRKIFSIGFDVDEVRRDGEARRAIGEREDFAQQPANNIFFS